MKNLQAEPSRWPHVWAWVLCCATFPLIWVGGLITTTDAGMAVPDWPGTYGYNLFLYPWQTWLFGPWDLLVEHGHRLFASGVGLLTIGLVVVVWRNDQSSLVRKLALAALGLVIFQGVLGGLRVVLNERLLAMLHGSTGPLFFGLTVALVVLTSRPPVPADAGATGGVRWVWLLPVLAYIQLVAGAALRHAPEDSSFNTFATHVQTHLWGALVVTLVTLGTAWVAWTRPVGLGRKRLAGFLLVVLTLQVSLGVATWVAKYRLPAWAQQGIAADAWEATVGAGTMSASTAGGWGQTHTVTGHSANGSLLLGLSIAHAVVATRRRYAALSLTRSEALRSGPASPPGPDASSHPAERRADSPALTASRT